MVRSSVLLLCGVLVVLSVRIESGEAVRTHPDLVSAAEHERAIEIAADVTGFPKIAVSHFGGESYGVQADAFVGDATVPMMLWIDGAPDQGIGPGARIQVRGTVEPASATASSAWSMSVRSITEVTPATGWNAAASALRNGVVRSASAIPSATLVPGFAVGDTSLVGDELSAAMLETGLTHLTAVSGANCALVVTAGIWFASWLGFGRKSRILLAGLMLLGFVGIVGPDSSVQRAAVMAGVVLISQFSGKRSQAFSGLGIAVLVLLLRDPWEAVQAGFALSVAATLGILLLAAPISRWLRHACKLPAWLAMPCALAVAAQVTCGPLLLLLQTGLPMVSIVANVLAAPAAPAGTALGLAATLLLPFWEWGGLMVLRLATLPARWVELVAEVGTQVPLGRWHWSGGWFGLITLTLVELLMFALIVLRTGAVSRASWERGTRHTAWRGGSQSYGSGSAAGRRVAVWMGAAGAGIALTMTLVAPAASRLGVPQDWALVSCDVGQGDATLLRDPAEPDFVMLIDTGEDEPALQACLDRFGVTHIDQLVLTHDDQDHVGALDVVAGITEQVIIAPANAKDGDDRILVRKILEHGLTPIEVHEGDTGGSTRAGTDALRWRVLAPARGSVPKDTNAASIVMTVELQGSRVLMLADTGKEEQQSMIAAGIGVTSEIVKIAHHGSKDQYLQLYEQSGAGAAFVSAGAKNSYGHPNADLLADLANLGMVIWRTDSQGTVALTLTGDAVRGFHERGDEVK